MTGETHADAFSAQVALRRPITVDFVNQFFAHYRHAVMSLIDDDERYVVTWVCDDHSISTPDVPSASLTDMRWVHTRCRRLVGTVFIQSHVVSRALTGKADVVVYTGDPRFATTWLAAAISRLRGRRVLMWTHGWTHPDRPPTRMLRLAFYNLANGLIVYARRARTIGQRMGYRKPFFVVGNSMGAPAAIPLPDDRDRRTAQRWIIVSRLIAERRLDAVLTQMARLMASGKRVELDVVGDGPVRMDLQAQAQALNVPVRFHGALYDPLDTEKLLVEADILLSPGHVGLAAIHALSTGCPVATHADNDRQMPEEAAVVPGVTGVRFERGDYEQMADLAWAFVASSDRAAVVLACHAEVARYWSPQAHAAGILNALNETVRR